MQWAEEEAGPTHRALTVTGTTYMHRRPLSASSATGGGLFEESPSLAIEKLLTQECSAFTRSSKQCISILSGQWFGENPPAVLAACVTPSTYRLKCLRATAVGQRGAL